MPKAFNFACRGFSLFLPVTLAVVYFYWVKSANSADPNETNALISACVSSERAAGRSGRACIGRVTVPCKAKLENAHIEDKIECDEREFVLWSLLVHKELAALEKRLQPEQRKKLQAAHELWIAYQSADCRFPYAIFKESKAVAAGPACTIELKASRALQLRAWRDAL